MQTVELGRSLLLRAKVGRACMRANDRSFVVVAGGMISWRDEELVLKILSSKNYY